MSEAERGARIERARILWQLEDIATWVIRSGNEYWDGYVRALEDVREDNWPNEPPEGFESLYNKKEEEQCTSQQRSRCSRRKF